MSDILCLDTEPETVAALRSQGHRVTHAEFGYRTGRRYCAQAPQDFDLILCDMKRPACFDVERWGPYGGNDNFKCAIIPQDQLSWEQRTISRDYGRSVEQEYRHKLISETQISGMAGFASPFGPGEVRQAISLGGVPAIIFLNPEWVLRTGGHSFPDFFGLRWETSAANATKFEICDPLKGLAERWNPTISFLAPFLCALRSGPFPSSSVRQGKAPSVESKTIVSDRIGTALGQVTQCGKGLIWLLPKTTDNGIASCILAENLQDISRFSQSEDKTILEQQTAWDVFLSHASENKDFTDLLYAELTKHGVAVWYDSSALKLGDSLRGKIDHGLSNSRYGVVVLSHNFFGKNWPKAELDGLVGLQMSDGRKRILPIWHGIDKTGVERYSPTLAGLMAVNSTLGVERVASEILAVIKS